jgi:hypothetical protein
LFGDLTTEAIGSEFDVFDAGFAHKVGRVKKG